MSQRFAALQELGEQFDGLPEATARPRHLWPALSAAGLALIAAAVIAAVLLTGRTPTAYAGWSRVPHAATPGAVAAAVKRCYRDGAPQLGQPVLAESRSSSTAAVYVVEGSVYTCLYFPRYDAVSSEPMGPLRRAPRADRLSVPYVAGGGSSSAGPLPGQLSSIRKGHVTSAMLLEHARLTAGDYYGYWALGQVGSGISAVTFRFANRPSVVATVQHGWYFAWWPWYQDPSSVIAQTSTGVVTAAMRSAGPPGFGRPAPGCRAGSSGCLFAKLGPASAPPVSVPTKVSRTVANTIRICDALSISGRTIPAEVYAGRPTISEVHGAFSAILAVTGARIYVCMLGGNEKNLHDSFTEHLGGYGPVRTAPAADRISVPYRETAGASGGRDGPFSKLFQHGHRPTSAETTAAIERMGGGGYGPYALGEVGRGVSAIKIRFANGKSVNAAIHDGFYFAWWPWISRPTSVTVTSGAGTVSSPANAGNNLAPGCKPGTAGCVFVRTPIAP